MAITIVKRPEGYVINPTSKTGVTIVNDGYGNAVLGGDLTHASYVYITDSYPQYCGFWYLVEFQTDRFYLREYPTGPNLAYVQNASIQAENLTAYETILTSKFNCVHLPIQYKLTSDLFPTNSVDTSRSVTQIENNNGFVKITVNGSLGTFEAFDWVKVSGATVSALNGPFQILTKHSSSQVTINAAYDLTEGNQYVMNAATVVKYYNNYHAVIRIYAGLVSGHTFYSQKPIVLIDTMEITPDDSNVVSVNINELVKEKIKTFRNNIYSDSNPYNLDAFCNYYIEVAESYDVSDGVGVDTFTSSYTSDSANYGWAIDSFLEFRNKYSGNMAEYLYASPSSPAKFLTMFTQPRLFDGFYFDLGVLNNAFGPNSILKLKRSVYIDNVLKEVFFDTINQNDGGLFRLPVERSGWAEDTILAEVVHVNDLSRTLFANYGTGEDWTILSDRIRWIGGAGDPDSTKNILTSYYFIETTEDFTVNISFFEGGGGSAEFYLAVFSDTSGTLVDSELITSSNVLSPTDFNLTLTVPSAGIYYVGFYVVNISAGTGHTATIFSITDEGPSTISETKTINVDQNCNDQNIHLTWKNPLGHYDSWVFTARKEYNIDIPESTTQVENIYPNWPNSYGEHAKQITRQAKKRGQNTKRVRSQFCTRQELDAISYIKTSPLVQIVYSKFKTETVLVDSASFRKYQDQDDLFSIEFTITETDQIPSQS